MIVLDAVFGRYCFVLKCRAFFDKRRKFVTVSLVRNWVLFGCSVAAVKKIIVCCCRIWKKLTVFLHLGWTPSCVQLLLWCCGFLATALCYLLHVEVCIGHYRSDPWSVAAAGEEAHWCWLVEVVWNTGNCTVLRLSFCMIWYQKWIWGCFGASGLTSVSVTVNQFFYPFSAPKELGTECMKLTVCSRMSLNQLAFVSVCFPHIPKWCKFSHKFW